MRSRRPLFIALFLTILSGCMVSEQIGQGNEDLTFHFDTQFNLFLLLGRSAALAVLGMWIYRAWKKSLFASLVAVAVLATAGWFLIRDFPSLKSYEVHVLEGGLALNIPPDQEKRIPWDSIELLELEGFEYMTRPMGVSTPFSNAPQLELPEWETMEITVSGGQKHVVNLKRLSIEQRQILARAIVKRAQLVEQ